MSFIEWSEKLVTGLKEVDDQHKKWISILNELHSAMKSRKGREVLDKVLDELHSYTIYHFSTEERYMERYGYPKFDAHKRMHEYFTNKVKDFRERMRGGGAPANYTHRSYEFYEKLAF